MEEQKTVVQSALRLGLIIGVANIIVGLLIYLIDPTLFAKWWLSLLIFAAIIVAVVVTGINYRNSIGGILSYGDAFKHGLIVFIISGLLGGFFNILLFQVIDKDVKQVVMDAAIEQTEAMMRKFGAPDDQIDETLQQTEESLKDSFSTTGQLKSQMYAIVFYIILSLITALIVRKQEKLADVV